MLKLFELAAELEEAMPVGVIQVTDKALLEECRKDLDVNEELGIRLDPTVACDGRPRTLHDAMSKRAQLARRPPPPPCG